MEYSREKGKNERKKVRANKNFIRGDICLTRADLSYDRAAL